ncbi:MAG: hypothetical protein M1833_000285 [Piccolia ochrophora]|nr:MAG: hypothetical protein M1833_000285 [Piccolia ochrophora]
MAGEVRQPIDVASLEAYIEKNVPDIKTPLEVKQFGFGQSNPTYQLTSRDGGKFVLRKKPPGKLLSKTAHKVEREYRIIHALEPTDVPVPKAYCLCEDDAVLGTPFYIMEFLDGRIFEDPSFPGVSSVDRTEMWRSAIHTLALLHRLSPASISLTTYGPPSDFYNRQIRTLGTISASQSATRDIDTDAPVGPIPHFPAMLSFFAAPSTQPRDRSSPIHGDYKIDNLVYHPREPRVVGILDWEMSTIGHPLSDLANLLTPYTTAAPTSPRASPAFHRGGAGASATPDLPSRAQCLQWYADVVGWAVDPREMAWADAFGILRGSVIMQGIAARYAVRQASSLRAGEYAVQMGPFGEFAWGLVERLKEGEEAERREEKAKL